MTKRKKIKFVVDPSKTALGEYKAIFDSPNFVMGKLNGDLVCFNRKLGRSVPTDGFKVFKRESKVGWISIDGRGKLHLAIETTADELLEFAKAAKQAEESFPGTVYLRHLNPELTFVMNPSKPKKAGGASK